MQKGPYAATIGIGMGRLYHIMCTAIYYAESGIYQNPMIVSSFSFRAGLGQSLIYFSVSLSIYSYLSPLYSL